MQSLQHVRQVHSSLGLHERIVALIKLMFNSFLISIRCDSKHFSPEAVILAVGETEDVVVACETNTLIKSHLPVRPYALNSSLIINLYIYNLAHINYHS